MQASAKRVPPIRKSRSQGLVGGIEASHMDELNLTQAQDESAAMETEHDVFDTAVEFEEVGSNDAIGDISASSVILSKTKFVILLIVGRICHRSSGPEASKRAGVSEKHAAPERLDGSFGMSYLCF